MLCNLCQSIDFSHSPTFQAPKDRFVTHNIDDEENDLVTYLIYNHHPDLESLYTAQEDGCHFCSQIRQELFHIRGHELEEEHHRGPIEIQYYLQGKNVLKPREIVVVAKTPIRDVKMHFDFVEYSPPLARLLEDKAFREIETEGCEDNLKLAISWLDRCLKTHSVCNLSTQPIPPLPSRVIDVESLESPSGIRLCGSEGRNGPYVTLSHVWGKAQIITTTLSTCKDRMASIAMEELSQTFRDAVVVAREMSIRYLWIDSLCIIQDSSSDWTWESAKMGQYYANSLFTIAAVSSSSGSQGCFLNRNPLKITPCPISILFPIGPVYGFLRAGIGWDPVTDIWGFQRQPLWQRAWVVQERLLSTRLLQFSSMQLSWKCRTEEASERVPEGSKDDHLSSGDRTLLGALLGLERFLPDQSLEGKKRYNTNSQLIELHDAWYDLVMLYQKCGLTKESDIFPAISGIAEAISNATTDIYLNGLWQSDIHRGLLWTAPDSTLSKRDLRVYRAPSWSWASLNGTASFYVRQILQTGLKVSTEMFKVNEVRPVSRNNPYGEVTVKELNITGLLKQAYPILIEDRAPVFYATFDNIESNSGAGKEAAVGHYFADNMDKQNLTEIWCCPIMTEERIIRESSNEDEFPRPPSVEARCLALLRLSKDKNIYMRVGSAWVTDYNWFDGCEESSFSIV